jgi:phosphopantothenoylcysteine decarboxylase/phosphopantothenate--cysteine ligase
MTGLERKSIVLGVTGGIAAYKAAELARLLVKAGASVRVVMTRAACRFVQPLTFQALTGNAVGTDLFEAGGEGEIGHIELADQADLVVVAPATADAIARFAAGLADDLLAAVVLATRAPIVLAPAMNVNMWENPVTRDNLARLVRTGRFSTVGPDAGELACGWVGAGRLVEPAEILAAAAARIAQAAPPGGRLAGRRVVVTAGPTHEAIDDVRYVGNRSSGKMGFALAAAAAAEGAEVTLVAGPVALPTPERVAARIDVESAAEMGEALMRVAFDADAVVMCAAVADFRPAERERGKLARRSIASKRAAPVALSLDLVPNPDLLGEIGRRRRGGRPRLLVGFAAEVKAAPGELVARARGKLAEKSCDLIVANDVGAPGLGFGSDRNAVTLVPRRGEPVTLGPSTKAELARQIWERLIPLLEEASGAAAAPGAAPAVRPI